MTQGKDLRIGNLIHTLNTSGKIHIPNTNQIWRLLQTGIFECQILQAQIKPAQSNDWFTIRNENISPIPLTEEILLKCGFKDNGQKIFDIDRFTFRSYKGVWSVYYINVWIKDLQFVHQFQNLYYVLTGEELNIEL
jgi:hypothetical protein